MSRLSNKFKGLRLLTQMSTRAKASLLNTNAISMPRLRDIDQRWSELTQDEQQDLVQDLRNRMKGSWTELTKSEKDAAYWLAFGNYGMRELKDYEKPGFYPKAYAMSGLLIAVAFGIFALTRYYFSPGLPHTLSKEWEEKTNERMRKYNVEPITGISAKDYNGKGFVQSK